MTGVLTGGNAASNLIPMRGNFKYLLQSQTVDGWHTIMTYDGLEDAIRDCNAHALYEGYASRIIDQTEGEPWIIHEVFPEGSEYKEVDFSWVSEGF